MIKPRQDSLPGKKNEFTALPYRIEIKKIKYHINYTCIISLFTWIKRDALVESHSFDLIFIGQS